MQYDAERGSRCMNRPSVRLGEGAEETGGKPRTTMRASSLATDGGGDGAEGAEGTDDDLNDRGLAQGRQTVRLGETRGLKPKKPKASWRAPIEEGARASSLSEGSLHALSPARNAAYGAHFAGQDTHTRSTEEMANTTPATGPPNDRN